MAAALIRRAVRTSIPHNLGRDNSQTSSLTSLYVKEGETTSLQLVVDRAVFANSGSLFSFNLQMGDGWVRHVDFVFKCKISYALARRLNRRHVVQAH